MDDLKAVGRPKSGQLEAILSLNRSAFARRAGWTAFFVLTAILLLLSLKVLQASPTGMPNTAVFGSHLSLFALLFYFWMGTMLYLAVRQNENSWRTPILVCGFSAVFFGVWILGAPLGFGTDAFNRVYLSDFVVQNGRLVFSNINLNYLQFPSFFLLVADSAMLSGWNVFAAMEVYLFASSIMISLLLYLFAKGIVGEKWAFLVVLVITMGADIERVEGFSSISYSYVLLVLILVIFVRGLDRRRTISAALVLPSFVTSYLPLPLYFFVFLMIGAILGAIFRKKFANPYIVISFVLIWLGWLIFSSIQSVYGYIQIFSPYSLLAEPLARFSEIFSSGGSFVGQSVPSWISFTRLSWLVLLYGVGGPAFVLMLRAKRQDNQFKFLLAIGVLSVAIYSLFLLFSFNPVNVYSVQLVQSQWTRFLQLAPIFLFPTTVSLLASRKRSAAASSYFLLMILVFMLAFPSFLILAPNFASSTIYPSDKTAVTFLTEFQANPMRVFSSNVDAALLSGEAYQIVYLPVPLSQTTSVSLSSNLTLQAIDWYKQSSLDSTFYVGSDFFPNGMPFPMALTASLRSTDLVYSSAGIELYSSLAR